MGFRVVVALTRSLTATLVLLSRLFSLSVLCFLMWIAHRLWKCTRRAFVAVYSIRMDRSSYSHACTYFCFIGIGFCYGGSECVVAGVSAHLNVCEYICGIFFYIHTHGEQEMCDYVHRNEIKIRLSIRIVFCLLQYNIRSSRQT